MKSPFLISFCHSEPLGNSNASKDSVFISALYPGFWEEKKYSCCCCCCYFAVLTPYSLKKPHHWNFVSAILYNTRMDKMLMKMISKFSYPEKEKDVPHQEGIGSFSIDDGNCSENVSFKMNSRFFNLCRVYSNLLKMASVGEFP